MDILELPIARIVVKDDRARGLDPAWAEGLAAIIAEQGLQQPIRVREMEGHWRLVAGLHRLEAHRLLERETIPAMPPSTRQRMPRSARPWRRASRPSCVPR